MGGDGRTEWQEVCIRGATAVSDVIQSGTVRAVDTILLPKVFKLLLRLLASPIQGVTEFKKWSATSNTKLARRLWILMTSGLSTCCSLLLAVL